MGKEIIVLVGSLDTKGEDYGFLREEIQERGYQTFTIDVGILGEPAYTPDISAEKVAEAAGLKLSKLREDKDRGKALEAMRKGIASITEDLHSKEDIRGIVSMGGGGGTALGTSAMRALPIGVPKVMVSTIASGDTSPYVGINDIVMIPAVVDVAGLNRISKAVYKKAAASVCAMAEVYSTESKTAGSNLLAASMFGNTTKAVNHARSLLEQLDYEVVIFHATGTGGRTMETLIKDGYFSGVLDITTTELADEICGGELSAGPERLSAASEKGIPQIITPACIDMCNFWAEDTIPTRYKGRNFYKWNPNVTLMRTNIEENRQIAELMAKNLNKAAGPLEVYLPLKGFSELDIPEGPFWWPAANEAFTATLKEKLRKDIPIHELEYNINDQEFSSKLAEALNKLITKKGE